MSALRSALARAGLRVEADEFLSLVEDAARRLSPVDPRPADYFSVDQRTALADVGLDLAPQRAGERDPRARAVALQAVLRDTALTVAGAAERIGVDASRIRHRLAAGRLAGWKDRGGWRLPVWQFTDADVLPGLEAVLAEVPADQPPLVVAGFMTTPQLDLEADGSPVTPRDWLLAGGDPDAGRPVGRRAGDTCLTCPACHLPAVGGCSHVAAARATTSSRCPRRPGSCGCSSPRARTSSGGTPSGTPVRCPTPGSTRSPRPPAAAWSTAPEHGVLYFGLSVRTSDRRGVPGDVHRGPDHAAAAPGRVPAGADVAAARPLTGLWPTRAGASQEISSGPKDVTQAWARAIRCGVPRPGRALVPVVDGLRRPGRVPVGPACGRRAAA